jgi:SSS family solute:Na+ symporter
MSNINFPILTALACYGLAMLAISLYWMQRIKKPIDLLMAKRGLGFFVLTGTILATGIGTGVTIGASGLAYRSGWGGCVYPIGIGVGIILVGLLFSDMRKYKFMTLGEEIACYYGGNKVIYNFSNITLFISSMCWLTVQIMGGGFIISLIIEVPIKIGIILAGILIAITSLPGGLLTVVYTDIFQVWILFIGMIVVVFASLGDVGGFASLRETVPSEYFSFLGVEALGWKSVIGIFLALMLHCIADLNNRHRLYSSTSARVAKRSMFAAGLFEILFAILIGILGMCVYSLNPNIGSQDQAIPWLVINVLPSWLAAIVVISLSAAIFSSGDSDAAVTQTFFIRHIYPMIMGKHPKNAIMVGRLALAVIFVLSIILALTAGTIVDFVVSFLSVILSGLTVVILLGRFWKRATWQGAVTAIIIGSVVSLLVIYVPSQKEFWGKPIIPATLFSLIGEVIVSLMTPSDKRPFEEIAIEMGKERKGVDY